MHIPRFYQTLSLAPKTEAVLDARASHHLSVVLRAKQGDVCVLFNGDGSEYVAEVQVPHKKQTQVQLLEQCWPETESSLEVHWAQCISAADRMDYTIQKATELGVMEITPIISARMSVKWRAEKQEKKLQHWQNIAISAAEQSFRVRVPKIHLPTKIADFMAEETHKKRFILDISAQEKLISQKYPENGIIFLVGPESGLSEAELQQASASGFKRIGFGPRVLRTETVAPAVLAVAQHLWGDI